MDQGSGTVVLEGHVGLVRNRAFFATIALLFLATASGTIWCCRFMAGGMAMAGGWTMSMAWLRMPGETWFAAAASFMRMWVVMMAAMMLPSLVPTLAKYRRFVRAHGETRLGGLTALVAVGYFLVWAFFGALAYPLGVCLAAAGMRWPAFARTVPLATGIVLLLAGCFQLTAWKARQLRCCRITPRCGRVLPPNAWSALQLGVQLGMHCVLCCGGFMMILLVTGVMNLGAMAIVAAAITIERLVPRPERVARAAGVVVIATGALLIARALGAD